ncbi:TPA: DUF2787 family protein [Escherichia coli]|uniref:DUF2787 family protein n=3 Tax=Escherichia coli TaxID=562 RepID=UPI0003EF6A01|nr:DUF2787 family protein [Escherichia coli]EER8557872.1 DUF2787 domain-containing protein [Escherichia coli]EEU9516257.1 DUF2787 domain-containing protein [Escherichia coli]EEV5552416.1 DUF2787 domain-containing protein [Escherichia coli]EEV7643158.1 DUF2787 domain-containing protein [Escherichia coli]EEV8853618.1 DUF2787 domain-containing protein [Escherichia coli]
MNINAVIQPAGFVLPVSLQLYELLMTEAGEIPAHQHRVTAVTLNFRDPDYGVARGGYHPVEIRLIHQADEWCLNYATDFGYVGTVYPELEKIIDISWSQGYVWHCCTGDLPLTEARALYSLWERNFLSYYASRVYTTRVLWES